MCSLTPLDDETFGWWFVVRIKKNKNTYLIVVGKCDENRLKKIKSLYNFKEILNLNVSQQNLILLVQKKFH